MCESNVLPYRDDIKVLIVGRAKDTVNYEKALAAMGISYLTTMELEYLSDFDALLLPGGGDITPAFFGQKNQGSKNMDTELDIIQLQALDFFVKREYPVFGICKGIQVINVYFNGTIIQDLKQAEHHAWNNGDRIHSSVSLPGTPLFSLYGRHFNVNSAHHQGIGKVGYSLSVIQTADDNVVEGIIHDTLPIIGVQWHPERLFDTSVPRDTVDGRPLFSYFLSLCDSAGV
ncbi:MAG: gamma-glutamyl-gamma-aminobutyrate hydrolase family protein [Clostridiales bacterium]|nr:gamma-glutamyl-gamma-aminobutyrate hydrolase family protein [Clostridiales bacterium]